MNAFQSNHSTSTSKVSDIDKISTSIQDINTSLKSIFIILLFEFILTLAALIFCIVIITNSEYFSFF